MTTSTRGPAGKRASVRRYVVGAVTDFPEGERRLVKVGRTTIGVFHEDGQFFAVKNLCPHRGAPMCLGVLGGPMKPSAAVADELEREGRVLRCPWHNWEFHIETGESIYGVTDKRLRTYPAFVED